LSTTGIFGFGAAGAAAAGAAAIKKNISAFTVKFYTKALVKFVTIADMRKLLLALAFAAAAPAAHAVQPNPFSGFYQNAATNLLKPFALDLGGLLGASTVDTGRTYGFPGFWVGGDAVLQTRPNSNDQILRAANVHSIALPMVQAGVGLPFDTDVVAHGVGAYGVTILGAGVRKSLFRTGLVDSFLPNVSVGVFGDKVNAGPFNASHGAANATATWNLPLIKPFVGAGYDLTKVTVGSAKIPSVIGASATATGSRLTAGVDLTPFPFVDVRAALIEFHGIPGGQLGLGVTF
jgi:hypothetical protein